MSENGHCSAICNSKKLKDSLLVKQCEEILVEFYTMELHEGKEWYRPVYADVKV